MDCYLEVTYISYLTVTASQLTLTYVSLILPFLKVMTDDYLRTNTRLYASFAIRVISPATISIKRFSTILDDPLTTFYVGTSGRES